MKHRKWARFLGLAAASLASLAVGAVLSYEASVAQNAQDLYAQDSSASVRIAVADSAETQGAVIATPQQTALIVATTQQQAVAAGSDAGEAAAAADGLASASLLDNAEPMFSASRRLVSPLTLTLGSEAPIVAAALHPAGAPEDAGQGAQVSVPQGSAPQVSGPQAASSQAGMAERAEETVQASAESAVLFHGRQAPLPVPRPAGLTALAAAPVETAATRVEAAAAPQAAPQSGSAPQVVTQQVATLQNPAPQASAPQAAAAANAPAPVVKAAASAPQQNGFPNITSALAAVTASVGGVNAAVTPGVPAPQGLSQGQAQAVLEPDSGGFKKGSPAYVRIFKREGVLELWLKRGDRFALYKSYPICKWSGQLGPKTRSADYQSPEGFYSVSARQLNPHSHYHLAFDLGYPNAYDRRQGATGNAVMVHGDCKSVGCFAMTNNGIDEIYGIVAAALANGQREVPVHIFPFRMTEQAIVEASAPKQVFAFLSAPAATPQRDWSSFWRNLKEGYDAFERSRVPPTAFACGDRYEFNGAGRSCARIAGW